MKDNKKSLNKKKEKVKPQVEIMCDKTVNCCSNNPYCSAAFTVFPNGSRSFWRCGC